MNEIRKLRVFLSYTHADIVPVRKLYQDLSSKDFDVWLDEENLIPGQEWKSEIEKALENSDVVIVCLSNNSVSKEGFVQREFKFALDKALEMTEDGIFLIPVRLDECKVPSKLSRYHWVDLFVDNGFNRLMKALSLRLSQVAEREKTFQRVNLEANTLTPEQDVKEKNHIEDLKEIKPKTKKEKPVKPPQKIESSHDERHSTDENILQTQLLPQENELDSITISKWNSPFRSLWLVIPLIIFIVFTPPQNETLVMAVTAVVVSLLIIIISFVQWNILRKYYARVSRWIGINLAYIILSFVIDYLVVATIMTSNSSLSWEARNSLGFNSFTMLFLVNFFLYIVSNGLAGMFIATKSARIVSFFGGKIEK